MTSSELNLIITYESQPEESLKCNSNDKIENVLKKFAEKKSIQNTSFLMLYGGKPVQGEELQKPLSQIMSGQDKEGSTMNILLYRKNTNAIQESSNINIILKLDSKNEIVLQGNREDKIRDILIKNSAKIDKDINSLIFKYENKNVDLDKKFDQIVNITDNNSCQMILNVYTQNKLIVNFVSNNFRQFRKECKIEDNIRNICNMYCLRFGKNISELTFRYNYFNLNLDQTFKDLLSDNDDIYSRNNIIDQEEENGVKEIKIIVIDNESFIKKYKKLIITITIILIIIIIIIIIIIVVSTSKGKEKEDSDSGSKTPYDSTKETEAPTTKQIKTCNPGYFIPLDDETLEDCQKCSLDKCIKCNGTYENNECISCGDLENIYENGKIIECKNTCETGPGEKCLTCYEDKIACKSCNTGYKLVDGKCRPDFLIEDL